MKKTLIALVALALAALSLSAPGPAAQASGTFGGNYATPGWWDNPNTLTGQPDARWAYASFPTACNSSPGTSKAWQVLWAYPSTTTSNIGNANRLENVRTAVAAGSSIFSASGRRTWTSEATFKTGSLAPKWVTTGSGCDISVIPVSIPAANYNAGNGDIYATGGIKDYLKTTAYASDLNRKYLVLLQTLPGTTGANYRPVADGDNNNEWHSALNPADNQSLPKSDGIRAAFAFLLMSGMSATVSDGEAVTYAQDIGHEMTHAMGGIGTAAPHWNSGNPGHPSDCIDIMCYGNAAGETYTSCGIPAGSIFSKAGFRLDCNFDDYWHPYNINGTFPGTLWNVASSSWLWGSIPT